MTELRSILRSHVDDGTVPGAVALVARGDRVEVEAVGSMDVEGSAPMSRDSIFRFASITKPVTAAAVMMLVEDGRIGLDDPVGKWLPEIAAPGVVREPAGPVEDVVPAVRPVTVLDLLTNRTGYGFPSDFSLPQVQRLFSVQSDGREVQLRPHPDEWMAALGQIPLLHQPGEAWLYDTSSDLQGVLVARVSGQSLPDFMAERLFEPLGMVDTAFEVPTAKRDRFTSYYKPSPDGDLVLADAPDGQWSSLPAFPAGAGGLAGTVDDWYRLGRILLSEGVAGGQRLLSAESVRRMTTDQLTPAQRTGNPLFLEGRGWGFGGGVDVEPTNPWNVPGRYGWTGGTGTSAHVVLSAGAVHILLTQRGVVSPGTPPMMIDFWRYAVGTHERA